MKTIALFTLLLIGVFGVITALIRAPIAQYFAEKNARVWTEAKETERATWIKKLHLPADCAAPKATIRALECRNKMKLHAQTFEQNWAYKVNTGWKPDGVFN